MKQLTNNYEIEEFLAMKFKFDGKVVSDNSIKELLDNGGKIEMKGKEYKVSIVIEEKKYVVYSSTGKIEYDEIYTSSSERGNLFLVRTFNVPNKFPVQQYGEFSYREKRTDSLFNQGYILYANREIFNFSLRKCVAEGKSACNLIFFEKLKADQDLQLDDILECLLRYSNHLGAEILRIPDFVLDLRHQPYERVSTEYMIGDSTLYL